MSDQSSFDAAVEFLAAQPDGPEKLLALHYPKPNGTCAGCAARPTPYPCPTARIGLLAAEYRRKK